MGADMSLVGATGQTEPPPVEDTPTVSVSATDSSANEETGDPANIGFREI